MTISHYISELLANIPHMKVITTNHVGDGSDKYGLFKSPARDVENNIDTSYTITEHYQFFAREAYLSESDRKDSDEWLEEIAYWVDDFVYEYEFPDIDGNRKVIDFKLTGAPYPMETEAREALYQMSLSITYIRERSY